METKEDQISSRKRTRCPTAQQVAVKHGSPRVAKHFSFRLTNLNGNPMVTLTPSFVMSASVQRHAVRISNT